MSSLKEEQKKAIRPEGIGSRGEHDNLDTHPERREAEVDDLENLYNQESRADEDRNTKPDSASQTEQDELPSSADEPGTADDENSGWDNKVKGKKSKKSSNNRRVAILSGIIGIIAGLLIALFNLLTPIIENFQLAHILGKNDSAQSQVFGRRINMMLTRFRRNDTRLLASRSRLGFVSNRTFGNMLDRLEQKGITLDEGRIGVTGKPRPKISISLPEDSPLRDGNSRTKTRLNLSKEMGIDVKKLGGNVGDINNPIVIDTIDLTRSEQKALSAFLGKEAGGGTITSKLKPEAASAINRRLFKRVFGTKNLFHPVSAVADFVGRGVDKTYFNIKDRLAQRRARKVAQSRRSRLSSKILAKYAAAQENAATFTKSTGFKVASAAIAVHTVVCTVKDFAGLLPDIYYPAVIAPMVIRQNQAISLASQVQSGSDINMQLLSDSMSDYRDSKNGSIWKAKALDALNNGGGGKGVDVTQPAKTAFATKGSSVSALLTGIGVDAAGIPGAEAGDSIIDVLCNPVARVVSGLAGLAMTVAGVMAAPVTGGASTAGAVARVAAQFVLVMQIVNGVRAIVSDKVEDGVANACGIQLGTNKYDNEEDNALTSTTVDDATAYGNCLAFASRMSANLNVMPMGGVPISSADERILLSEANEQELAEFSRKSLPERLFSVRESKSLLANALKPSTISDIKQGNMSNFATGLLKTPFNIFSNSFASLSPKTYAEPVTTYDFGFDLVSMPLSIVDNPEYEDPYENTEWIVNNKEYLDNNKDKIKSCFGVEIVEGANGLQTKPFTDGINPLSDDYNDSNCGDLNDEAWIRTALFVTDDSIIRTYDCWDDNEASCDEIGVGLGAQNNDNANGGGAINQNNPAKGEDTSAQQCTAGNDLGVKDTPTNGIKIRICNVEGIDVNVAIENNVRTMLADARAVGINLGGGGFRSYQEQINLRKSNCGTSDYDIYQKPSGQCSPPTARPGSSMHEWGLALDIMVGGSTIKSGSAAFNWLQANASKYGLKNLPSEAWHWSTTGT